MLSQWVGEYLGDCYGLAEGTRRLYEYHLSRFTEAVGDGPLRDVDAGVVRRYLSGLRRKDGEPYSPHYVDQVYRTLNTFFRWCVREGATDCNPMERVRRPRVPQTKSPRLTIEEVERVLEAVERGTNPARDMAMILLAVESGLRRAEVVGLEIGQVDLEGGIVRVIGKGSKERFVPIDKVTREALRRWLDVRPKVATNRVFVTRLGGPFTVNGAQTMMYRLKERAGLPEVRWHVLRHTFANHFVENGGGLRLLQKILGHSSIETTARLYTDPELDALKRVQGEVAPLSGRNGRH